MNKTWWWQAAFISIIVLLGAGVLILITRPSRGEPVVLLPPPSPAPMQVYVNGAVNQVGLVTLQPGSRVNDAIQAAGGFSSDADSSTLNLARMLEDGEQIYVPSISTASSSGSLLPTEESRGSNLALREKININTATLEQLDTLPGIGLTNAQAIIDFRNVNGPFSTIDGILEVNGIGPETFDKIKDLISVGIEPQ